MTAGRAVVVANESAGTHLITDNRKAPLDLTADRVDSKWRTTARTESAIYREKSKLQQRSGTLRTAERASAANDEDSRLLDQLHALSMNRVAAGNRSPLGYSGMCGR
ncbi:hypothetical protein ALC62_11714 [Cyphomyrmex costatus]|uniref:Uncharacterized protein n=1 Tax=Cyphomyrmex costatus TaxID=456900 RepID=A0A195C9C3_9HYME|nr:hypothetical protein ALC62_11714 [Cyphomyrmex costatus]